MKQSCIQVIMVASFMFINCTMVCAQTDEVITKSYQSVDQYWQQAAEFKEQGKYAEATELYEKGINIEETNPSPREEKIITQLNALGDCYVQRSQYATAFRHYNDALKQGKKLSLDVEVASSYTGLGKVYQEWGQYEKALEHFQIALDYYRKLAKNDKIAHSLNNIGDVTIELGNYNNAMTAYQEALKFAKLSGNRREEATGLNGMGGVYNSKGHYEKALEYFQQALDVTKQLEKHSDIVVYYHNVGFASLKLGKYQEALEFFQQALTSAREFDKQDYVASILNSIGGLYAEQSQYEKALTYFEDALEIDKELGRRAKVTLRMNNICALHLFLGSFMKAQSCLKEKEEFEVEINRKLDIARDGTHKGIAYHAQGEYDKAIEYFQQALKTFKELEREPDIATTLNNIASVYYSWGQYTKAFDYFEQALDRFYRSNMQSEAAKVQTNIGNIYLWWDQYDQMLELNQEALKTFSELGKNTEKAICYNNIGFAYLEKEDDAKAIEAFEQALKLAKELDIKAEVVKISNNLGMAYFMKKESSKALAMLQTSLKLAHSLDMKAEIAINLDNIGTIYYGQSQYHEAIKHLSESVQIKEQLRKTATEDARRDYVASQVKTYQLLTSCYLHTDNVAGAFGTIEISRAKWLTEQLAQSETITIPPLADIQQTVPKDTAVIIYANTDLWNIIRIIITTENISYAEYSTIDFIQHIMKQYGIEIEKFSASMPALKKSILNDQKMLMRDIGQNDYFAQIINYYRWLLYHTSESDKRIIDSKMIGNFLHEFLFDHASEDLAGKTKLLIVPDGWLNFIPFETLVNNRGKYLVENYHISYAHSLSVLNLIQQRQYEEARKPLLAFGGAVYNGKKSIADKNSFPEIDDVQKYQVYLYKQFDDIVKSKASLHALYALLGIAGWDNLPASLREVSAIRSVVSDAHIVKYDEVNEGKIKAMSGDGSLADYKVLHFATHGVAVPEIPELSALILSQRDSGEEDNYLRVGEIAELKLHADFVNLSACETGLGKLYSGEGVVGLTQAFLLAGANGTSVSLWRVAEDSTAQFMNELYKLHENEEISYDQATTEVKRRFITGRFGKKYKAPYYWAPFVYYGKIW